WKGKKVERHLRKRLSLQRHEVILQSNVDLLLVLPMLATVARFSAVVTLLLGLASTARAEDRAYDLGVLCTSCHGSQLQGNQDIGAPSIAGLPEWYLLKQLE